MTCITAMNTAFEMTFSPRTRIVYLYLAKLSNKEDSCFPSIRTIMSCCSISESSVKRALAELVAMGLLIKEAQYRRDNSQTSNRYTLQSPQSAEKPATDVNPAPVQNEPPGVSEMNPQELEYTNLIMDSALTDRPARERVGSSAQPQYEEKATAAEEEKEEPLEAVLERCELPLFTAEWRIMFYQAVVSLYFSGNIKVGKARIPSRWIRRCMKHLNYHALEAARDKLERCDFSEIRNTGAYVQAVVFNSIMELESDLLGWVSKVPASWIPLSS